MTNENQSENEISSDISNKVLLDYYTDIHMLLNDKNYDEVTRVVNELLKIGNTTLWVGLPRLTFMWRKYLPEWDSWVVDSIIKFNNIGEDGKKIMKGLY